MAFVVYPYAVTTIAGAPFWAILFFIMLVLLGISSTIASIEVTIASILDTFKGFGRTKLRRKITITIIFFVYFCLGLIFCLKSGTYWVEVFNTYTGGEFINENSQFKKNILKFINYLIDWAILLVGAAECIIVCYIYGLKNFINDINTMMGEKNLGKSIYVWCTLWCVACPLLCLVSYF